MRERDVSTITVTFRLDDLRALVGADCIDNGDDALLSEEQAGRITGALRDALAEYDGPDEDDGRAFTDAHGMPFYEP